MKSRVYRSCLQLSGCHRTPLQRRSIKGVIRDYLELDAYSYTSISVGGSIQKIILPNAQLIVFETRVKDGQIADVRNQLASITVEAHFKDIFDNQSIISRSLEWFNRTTLSYI
ncbi:hypothetical protein QE390_000712 [Siphonobacter sp. SORGH_AS 1065]|nr:hypothetical protein [Siphonobacter sp. SORGH_AS_1065]